MGVARHGREIERDDERVCGVCVAIHALEHQQRVQGVVAVDPAESGRLELQLMQAGVLPVQAVQIGKQAAHAFVRRPGGLLPG